MLHPQILFGRKSFQMHVKIFMKPNSVILSKCMRKHPIEPYLHTHAWTSIWADCWLLVGVDVHGVWGHMFSKSACLRHKTALYCTFDGEALQSILLSAWVKGYVSQLCFIVWINYSLLEFCVSVCMCARVCIFCYCKRKWQSPSTTSRPHIFECINSMAIANASPMPITFLWIAKMEGDRDMGRQRYGEVRREVCAGVRRRGRSSVCMSLSLLKTEKKILNVLYALESLCVRNFKIPLTPLFFFPLLCVYKLQTVTQLFPWQ